LETVPLEEHAEPQTTVQERTDWRHFLLDLLETVGLAVILFLIINTLSARVRVDGFSMLPTLHDGEFVLVNKLAYRLGSPTRGDIIVFQSTTVKDLDLIKRVIGLAGDQVVIGGDKVYVNGQLLAEPYIAAAPTYSGDWRVPNGFLFVLGDNRTCSVDSRVYGAVERNHIKSRA
jgi:signal peptidase I